MKSSHKTICLLLLISVSTISYKFDAKLTEALAQNLVTFFSISFGFFTTALAIVYNSALLKELHEKITADGKKREIHVLSSYLKQSAYWSIGSILSIIIYMMFSIKVSDSFVLNAGNFTVCGYMIYIDTLLSSVLFGVSSVNIFMMILVFNSLLYGMLIQAKHSDKPI